MRLFYLFFFQDYQSGQLGLQLMRHSNHSHRSVDVEAVITFRVRRSRGEMYIGHGRLSVCVCVCVCLSLTAFPRYCTDPDVGLTWWMVGVPSSCALLGGFVIGAQVSLLWQHSAEREMSASACTRSTPGLSCITNCYDILALRCLSYGSATWCCTTLHAYTF